MRLFWRPQNEQQTHGRVWMGCLSYLLIFYHGQGIVDCLPMTSGTGIHCLYRFIQCISLLHHLFGHNMAQLLPFGKLTWLATPIWRSTKFYMLKWELFHHQPWFWPWFGAVALQAPCWILKSVKSGCVCQEPCNVCTIQTQVGKIASSYDIKCSIYCLYLQKIVHAVHACAWLIRKY